MDFKNFLDCISFSDIEQIRNGLLHSELKGVISVLNQLNFCCVVQSLNQAKSERNSGGKSVFGTVWKVLNIITKQH